MNTMRNTYPLHTFSDSQLRAAEHRAPAWTLSPVERHREHAMPRSVPRRPAAVHTAPRVRWSRVLAVVALVIAGALAVGL